MHAAHSIFGQKLLQVHVLKLEEAPICRQGAIPQERPKELVEISISIATSTSTAIAAITACYSTAIPHGADSQRVFIKVQSVFVSFHFTRVFQTLVSFHGVLQEGLQTCHGVVVPPCQGACGLIATSKLWACPSCEVRGGKLGELPGHPGPDGVSEKNTWRGEASWPEHLPMGQVLGALDLFGCCCCFFFFFFAEFLISSQKYSHRSIPLQLSC